MKFFKLLIFALIIFTSCNQEETKTSSNEHLIFEKEIDALNSAEKQKAFLEEIFRLDQKVRTDETAILEKYGHDSKEHKASWITINTTDEINLKKVEYYLNKYGHPTRKEHGARACETPWIVIHHVPSATGARRRNFKYLHKAWKKEDLAGGQFAFYLNRLFANENGGKRLEIKSPFTEAFEIDTLLEVLKLKEEALSY